MTPEIDRRWIVSTARAEGFNSTDFERSYRLAAFIEQIGRHPQLSKALLLKGGSNLNFFVMDLPRLSVDLDLNYIAHIGKTAMVEDRPDIETLLKDLATSNGYRVEKVRTSYSSWHARLLYKNVHGSRDSIKIDLNYLTRIPLFTPAQSKLPEIFDLGAAPIQVMAPEEAYGSKITALVSRAKPRDLFDCYLLFDSDISIDSSALRLAFLFYAYMDDATLDLVDLEKVKALDSRIIERWLYPMLKKSERPTSATMIQTVLPELERMLVLSESEISFGTGLEAGRYQPELLFGEIEVSPDIDRHPAALWRAQHPHGKRDGKERNDD